MVKSSPLEFQKFPECRLASEQQPTVRTHQCDPNSKPEGHEWTCARILPVLNIEVIPWYSSNTQGYCGCHKDGWHPFHSQRPANPWRATEEGDLPACSKYGRCAVAKEEPSSFEGWRELCRFGLWLWPCSTEGRSWTSWLRRVHSKEKTMPLPAEVFGLSRATVV